MKLDDVKIPQTSYKVTKCNLFKNASCGAARIEEALQNTKRSQNLKTY